MIIKKKVFIGVLSTILFFGAYSEISIASDYGCNLGSMKNLAKIKAYAERRGFSCRGRARGLGFLKRGQNRVTLTTLYRGNHYLLIGAGNEHVKDLDLILYDENGNFINSDRKSDALPIVEVHPKWTGRYYIKGHMDSGRGCSNVMICN